MLWLLKDFDLLSVLLRAATLSLEAFTLGGLFFLLIVARPGRASGDQLWRTRRATARFASALALAQACSAALSVAILMGGSGFSFRSLLSAGFLVESALEIAGCLTLAALLGRASLRAALLVPSGALVLATSVAQSHAASRIDHRGVLVALTALHHLGTAGWVGAMLFLLLALRVSPTLANAQALARRYSRMALVGVATLVVAGMGMSWFYIGSWAGLYGTTYGVMVLAKTTLLLLMLLLGAGNYQLLRAPELPPVSGGAPTLVMREYKVKRRSRPFLLRLRRFSEAEIGLGITAILAAASLTSQPPAIDLQQDRLSFHEIVDRMRWEPPRLSSPPFAELAKPGTLQQAIENAQYGAGGASDANDRAWSEYNHHWAGMIVLAAGLLALAARLLPPGRLRGFARNWPLFFLGLAALIVLRADPENWPLGPRPFWASFSSPDVLQHRAYAVLITAFALFEWAVATGRWRGSPRAAYVFPLLCAAGGAALLTHSHGLSNVKDEMLAELAHTPIAILGAAAGWGRWLQLRLPGESPGGPRRRAGMAGFARARRAFAPRLPRILIFSRRPLVRGVFNLSCAHDPVSGKGRCFVENAVRADHMLLKAIENLLAAQLSEVRAQMHVLNDRVTRMNARMDGLEKTMAAAFSNLSQELNTYNDVQKLKERMARVEGEYHMKPSA